MNWIEEIRDALCGNNDPTMKSFADMRPKPRAIPKARSRTERRRAFMHRHRNASKQSSRMLTERINPSATSGMMRMPRCAYEIEPKLTIIETRSEEHTSELQSLRHLVCRLLL